MSNASTKSIASTINEFITTLLVPKLDTPRSTANSLSSHGTFGMLVTFAIAVVVFWLTASPAEPLAGALTLNTHTKATSGGKYEQECRRILERLLKVPFPSARPAFLKNPKTGRNLELDMYSESLKLAAEYNGIQHRRYSQRFHRTVAEFEGQVERDQLKRIRCQQHGIRLIEIPDTVQFDKLTMFIAAQLEGLGIKLDLAKQPHNRSSTLT